MKKIWITLLLVVLLALAVIPAAASGNGPGDPKGPGVPQAVPQGTAVASQQRSPRGIFTITGTVSAIDTVNNTVTIMVSRGNKLTQPYLGTDVTVVTSTTTKFLYKSSTTATATKIAITDIQVGNPVSVTGTVKNFTWTATRITVGANLSCLP